MRTILQVLKNASQSLITSETPELDAELLLAKILNCSRTTLHTWPDRELSEQEYQRFQQLCDERRAGKPVAYLLGTQPFWKFNLRVTPDVLIPRADTEILIEKILLLFGLEKIKVLDLGTGSGAIALALAYERPQWEIIATDKSVAALEIAAENARNLSIKNIQWLHSDWFAEVQDKKFNLIVSNPPYIAPNDPHLQALQFEPATALIAEKNGLQDLEQIIAQAQDFLLPQGYLIVEHGYQQADKVQEMMKNFGFSAINTYNDLGGNERVTLGKK
jgi:release factor glutamine methyltransferase